MLSDHTWYKIGIMEDGVYGIGYDDLQSLGIDMQSIDPLRIRMFGNAPGLLPEGNAEERFDDLTEIAIQVTGSEDGSFDADDLILFYANGPVNMRRNEVNLFEYERNPYTDTLFCFLCVDANDLGLRIQERPSVQTGTGTPAVNTYQDFIWQESEEVSPYASGRTWYGDLITGQDGFREFVFNLPDRDPSHPIRIDSKVLGRNTEAFSYNLKINDLSIVNDVSFRAYKQREFGVEHSAERTLIVQSDPIKVRYEINPSSSNPMLFIDYFTLSYWRALRFRNHAMAFRIFPGQIIEQEAIVQVDDVHAGVHCWDVTDPLRPCLQQVQIQSSVMSFGVTDTEERLYYLFDMTGVKQIASMVPIDHQNLHGITDAELLIITPRVFWNQSEALADFHREVDGMSCVTVDVKEIYNEFGTGVPDPTAIRDFIRMVYLRSQGNLKYVLLMGKGTHDFRCIKGVDNNYVPTYQSAINAHLEVESKCSDDYYALMDVDEGSNCEGLVDLGVGRLPITTPEQGDAMVEKIRHYADLSHNHGLWKNNHLLVADNDVITYANYAETLSAILDTVFHQVNVQKVYLDSYPLVSTASGVRVPQANEVLMDAIDKGVCVMSYTGHGGVKGLATEQVISVSDVQSMDNYDKLPFVHTATCEFSKFDNPTEVSAGELMILNPLGGAIAMLTTVRPTHAHNNQYFSRSFHERVYETTDLGSLRMGDIYRLVKTDRFSKANTVYVLFGDPALRFSYPTDEVQTERMEGNAIRKVEGFVSKPNGVIDTQFNGELEFRVYDQKTHYSTLGQMDGNVMDYSFFHDILFEGKVSVTDGRFSLQFPVSANISYGNNTARLSYYAYDSIREVEANGVCEDLFLNASALVDNQGPDIHLYWNTPDFENGSSVSRRGVLYADLFDEHGIYHYNVSIGRDLVLKSSIAAYDNMILNDCYEPALDDYRRGRVAVAVGDLEDGTYSFSLKAWDTQNNSSETEIVFVVQQGALVSQVYNKPNPFADETWFTFTHGDMTDHLSVVVEVFDVLGRRVAMFQRETDAVEGVVTPIGWNGSALRSGLYLYRLTVTNSEGKSRTVSQRMVKK